MKIIKKYKVLFIASAIGLLLAIAVASDSPDLNVFQAFISIEVIIFVIHFIVTRRKQKAAAAPQDIAINSDCDVVDLLCNSIDPEFVSYVLPLIKSGISYSRIEQSFRSSHPDSECADLRQRISYIASYHSNATTLQNLSSCGASHYTIISCDDDSLCDLCRSFKGRSLPVSAAKIGYNCPPFHLGCRCSMVISDKK